MIGAMEWDLPSFRRNDREHIPIGTHGTKDLVDLAALFIQKPQQ